MDEPGEENLDGSSIVSDSKFDLTLRVLLTESVTETGVFAPFSLRADGEFETQKRCRSQTCLAQTREQWH